jgi:hypothetical protein
MLIGLRDAVDPGESCLLDLRASVPEALRDLLTRPYG